MAHLQVVDCINKPFNLEISNEDQLDYGAVSSSAPVTAPVSVTTRLLPEVCQK